MQNGGVKLFFRVVLIFRRLDSWKLIFFVENTAWDRYHAIPTLGVMQNDGVDSYFRLLCTTGRAGTYRKRNLLQSCPFDTKVGPFKISTPCFS